MSAHMKKHPISNDNLLVHVVYKNYEYHLPINVLNKFKIGKATNSKNDNYIPASDLFTNIEHQYTKPGVMLRGLRYRENLTQIEFSRKLKITQADLSKLENGKRPIGRKLAQKIAKIFKIDYRVFLS